MWQRGVAKVVRVRDQIIEVRCPHCKGSHQHSRQSMGSKEVVAGCHKGYDRCLSYSIPQGRRR